MAILVVIPMCDGFDQRSVTLTLLMAILLYVALLNKNSVAVLANV